MDIFASSSLNLHKKGGAFHEKVKALRTSILVDFIPQMLGPEDFYFGGFRTPDGRVIGITK